MVIGVRCGIIGILFIGWVVASGVGFIIGRVVVIIGVFFIGWVIASGVGFIIGRIVVLTRILSLIVHVEVVSRWRRVLGIRVVVVTATQGQQTGKK